MTLAASLRPVAFSVQVHTAPNFPLEREVEVRMLPRPKGQQEPVLCSPLPRPDGDSGCPSER